MQRRLPVSRLVSDAKGRRTCVGGQQEQRRPSFRMNNLSVVPSHRKRLIRTKLEVNLPRDTAGGLPFKFGQRPKLD